MSKPAGVVEEGGGQLQGQLSPPLGPLTLPAPEREGAAAAPSRAPGRKCRLGWGDQRRLTVGSGGKEREEEKGCNNRG